VTTKNSLAYCSLKKNQHYLANIIVIDNIVNNASGAETNFFHH